MVTFDGPNLLIYIDIGVITINAIDLYSDWKRWAVTTEGLKFAQAFRSIGGEEITDTKNIAGYIETLNGWRLKPWSGDYVLAIDGNLFATGGLSPFIQADSGTIVINLETTGNSFALNTGTGSGTSPSDVWNYHERTLTDSSISEFDFAKLQSQMDTLQAALEFAIDNVATIDVVDTGIMQTNDPHRVKYEGANLVFNKPADPI